MVKEFLASFITTSCNSENPLIPTSGSSSENVRGKFFSLLFLKVGASWRLARENANCLVGVYRSLTVIDPGPEVPHGPGCSELAASRNFSRHHCPDLHLADDNTQDQTDAISPGDEFVR